MAYLMIDKERNKSTVAVNHNKNFEFRTVVSKVPSFVGNPVYWSGTGLLIKDETSETIVRDLFSAFSCILGSMQ